MAVKRMMNTNIINTDEFLSMPMSARLLYYDFCMRGDDDGFIDPFNGLKDIENKVTELEIKYILPVFEGETVYIYLKENKVEGWVKRKTEDERFVNVKVFENGIYIRRT